ncbi:MAG: SDR family oxidoreductase [Gammaproteobacteria bacterium]|nr:SDR family oxidoreductase [Gammaproteobacteria bacterium]
MDLGLRDRIALVTGASRGIGHGIASALACEGVHLGLLGRDIERCQELGYGLREQYQKVRVLERRLDLNQTAAIPEVVRSIAEELGGIDILVNCAGGAYRGKLLEIPDSEWERWFQVKPLGLIRMTRECLPWLRKSSQARVINIAGIFGREPAKFSVMGAPINMATLSVTKALANELGPQGITVNAISPGPTDTGRGHELVKLTARDLGVTQAEAEIHLLREVPMRRVLKVEDIAALTLFLASSHAGMISGTAINIDGGRSRSI